MTVRTLYEKCLRELQLGEVIERGERRRRRGDGGREREHEIKTGESRERDIEPDQMHQRSGDRRVVQTAVYDL